MLPDQVAEDGREEIGPVEGQLRVVHHQDPVGAVTDIVPGDPLHLVPQENRRHPSRIARERTGHPQHLHGQPVLGMVAVVSENPDLQMPFHGPFRN